MQVEWVQTHGKRERNALVIYLEVRHNSAKAEIIPDVLYDLAIIA